MVYQITHTVGFEETNLVGNVYYVNHLRWQGRCREMFLREHAPDVIGEIRAGLCFVTTRCSCDYLAELAPFDEIAIRMRLDGVARNRMSMSFEYWRTNRTPEELVARGEQEVACMRREGEAMKPAPFPESLVAALQPFMAADPSVSRR
jgi:enediyne biosynthesis thioesterase